MTYLVRDKKTGKLVERKSPIEQGVQRVWDNVSHTYQHMIAETVKEKKQIVHGQRALNKQLPPFLRKPTFDFDLWVNEPKKAMIQLEKKLEAAVPGNQFSIGKETLPNVWGKAKKVIYHIRDNASGRNLIDYSKTPRGATTVVIDGVQYQSLQHAKQTFIRILQSPDSPFHQKAKAQYKLQMIRAFELENQRWRP